MKNQFFALLLSAVFVAPAYASGADIGAGESSSTTFESKALEGIADFAGRNAEINAELATGMKFSENVVLVNQLNAVGHETFAYVNQSGGAGNLAVIMQDARMNSATAMVFQVGSGNRAIVNQH